MAQGLLTRRAFAGLGIAVILSPGLARAAVSPRPPGPKPAPPRAVGPLKRFAPETWGYHLSVPADWIVTTPEPYTVVFSGPEGTDAYFAPVAVQNREAPVPGDPERSAVEVLAAHRETLRARYDSVRVIRETLFRVPPGAADGGRDDLPAGRQLVAEWAGRDGLMRPLMRQWAVVRPRPKATVVHLWTYTAEHTLFDLYLPMARTILDSWTLQGV